MVEIPLSSSDKVIVKESSRSINIHNSLNNDMEYLESMYQKMMLKEDNPPATQAELQAPPI